MKKLYTFAFLLTVSVGLFAQSARPAQSSKLKFAGNKAGDVHPLATGDTLLYIPFGGIFVNPTDLPTFSDSTEDNDMHSSTTSNGFPSGSFGAFYSVDPVDHMAWEPLPDTVYYIAATSWFNTPAQANNWFEFGPITIPAAGANLRWFVKTNATFRDGYRVLTSTTGRKSTDFTAAPVYSRPDCGACGASNGVDTLWQPKTVHVNGPGPMYFAFNHNATDMDVLYIDEILITEGPNAVKEQNANILSLSNMPNPAVSSTLIQYELKDAANVEVALFDIAGKKVLSQSEGMRTQGMHQIKMDVSSLTPGMYFYTLTAGNFQSTQKLTVVK